MMSRPTNWINKWKEGYTPQPTRDDVTRIAGHMNWKLQRLIYHSLEQFRVIERVPWWHP